MTAGRRGSTSRHGPPTLPPARDRRMKRTVLTAMTAAAVAVLALGVSAASPQRAGASTTLLLTVNGTSAASVTYGDETSLVFAVSIDNSLAAGKVTIESGTTTLCTVTLVSAAGHCSPSNGTQFAPSTSAVSVLASYPGDVLVGPLTSSPVSVTVNQVTTTTSLSVSPSSTVLYGQESDLTFTAGVSPVLTGAPPTGTLTVDAGPTVVCSIALPADSCSSADDPLAASSNAYAVTATYLGDTNYATSTSPVQHLTVGQATTTLALSVSPTTVIEGDESTLQVSAIVSPRFSGSPSGTITVTASPSTATLCTITLPATTCPTLTNNVLAASTSPYQIVATYTGDANFTGSTSNTEQLTVSAGNSMTTLAMSPSSVVYGDEQTVTFSSTVTPTGMTGTPTGTITISAAGATGPIPLCSFDVTTATSCTTSPAALPALSTAYAVIASYAGGNFLPSASNPQDFTVQQATTTTSLTPPTSSVAYGGQVTFSSTVLPQFSGTPTGIVTVASESTTLCEFDPATATGCTANISSLDASATPYAVVATYDGDQNFSSSLAPSTDLTVTRASSGTALMLSTSAVAYGDEQSVAFTATVTPEFTGSPTGTVTVATGPTTLCTVLLPTTTPSCTTDPQRTSMGASGTPYAVTASYSGDGNFTRSQTTAPSYLTVDQATTTVSLSASPPSVTYGDGSPLTFTASVVPAFSGSPTGTMTVAIGTTTLCTITLPATDCSAGLGPLDAGAYTVNASYPGDANFQPSSGFQGVTVDQAAPSAPDIVNLPSGATEEGSFTAAVVTNGDGGRSVVSDTPGNCAVGSDGVTVRFLVEGTCTLTPQVSSGRNYAGANGSPQTFTIAPGPRGYWLVGSDGGIFSFGAARFHGSMGGTPLQRPVVGITPTSSKNGYWLVASDGGIFAFGDANFFGSIPGVGLHPSGSGLPHSLDAPIVGMVPSHDGDGYFMVASDGGVFAFGDARFAGSCPGIGGCSGAAVAVMPDASGNGYWLVTAAGDVYAFGDAPFFGAPSPQSTPVVNAVATPDGAGYWVLYANGAVLSFGDAHPYGGPVGYVNAFNPATSIFPTTDSLGYWVASAKGDVFTFGNAPFLGSMSATPLNGPIVAAFGF